MRIEELQISSHTGIDACGRVFFHNGRVLRAINPQSEKWVQEFLASNLYKELEERGWFVKSWIAKDIKVEGYPLIIESEKVYACQWQLLTFSQLRDASILAIIINKLCNQYGWALFDDWFNNFGLKDGQILYFDLGGFFKIGQRQLPELTDLVIERKVLQLKSLGMNSLANITKPWPDADYNEALLPLNKSKLDEYLVTIFHPMVEEYTVYRKKSRPALFKVKTLVSLNLINWINNLAKFITKKTYPWNLLYVVPKYKLSEQDFENIKPYYSKEVNLLYFPDDAIKYFQQCDKSLKNEMHKIMVYGEYSVEDLESLRRSFDGEIWLCSPHLPYTDYIYSQIKVRKIDIGIISYNFCYNTIHDNEKIIELGIDCLLCPILSIATLSEAEDPTYILGKLSKYFNKVILENNGSCTKYIKENKIFKSLE